MGHTLSITSTSAEDTKRIARQIADSLPSGMVLVLLTGELGAGKTTFVQGLAEGLGITGKVTSPTFLMMKEHYGARTLRHIDLYRVTCERELEHLGILEDVAEDAVLVVEWAERIPLALPCPRIAVNFRFNEEADGRELVVTCEGIDMEEAAGA